MDKIKMEKLDRVDWEHFRSDVSTKLTQDQFQLVCELHAKYFKHRFYKPCTCSPRVINTWIAQLNDLYESDHPNKQT